jgi:endonuclease YncB( thermonuclease family)
MRIGRALLALAMAGAAIGLAAYLLRAPDQGPGRGPGRGGTVTLSATQVRVVDGDSLELDGVRVRLLGIDALERAQTCRDPAGAVIPCGHRAQDALEALVEARPLRCLSRGQDRFGRSLAVCTNGRGVEVNRALVQQGWALAFAGDDTYAAEERAAAAARRGIHAWEFVPPGEWRRGHR